MIDRFQAIRDINTDNEEIRTIENHIKRGKRAIQSLQEETYKNDYRLGKCESEINKLEIEIANRKNDIREIAKKIDINKLRPNWMTTKVLNKLDEVRYWCS